MLANLDNEVHFKNVFTDIEVFTAFVKDVLDVEVEINKIETEKVLPSKVSAIKFRMDLFAEDAKQRTVIEIQKVDYDYTYDRFAHYFLGNLIDMQRSSKDYSFEKDVYIIVVVTAAYRISDKHNKPIKDEILITDINPRNLRGQVIEMHDHKMVILNTTYKGAETPTRIRDWMDLIRESMKNPEKPNINLKRKAIAKAAKLAEVNRLTPEQLAEAKELEMRKATIALIEDITRKETTAIIAKETEKATKDKGIKRALASGKLSKSDIADLFEVDLDYIKQLLENADDAE